MKTYPLFAIIADKPCLVVGGGAVGERKVLDLVAAGAKVTVVSPAFTPKLAELAGQGLITAVAGDFHPAQVDGMVLVIGATDDTEVNRQVSAAAQARGVFVNIVDAPELCTFIVPAQVRRGDLTVAISTGGASPALAKRLRLELENYLQEDYGPFLALLQAIRERLLALRRGHPDNAALFNRLVESPVRQALAQGNRARVEAILAEILGEVLPQEALEEILAQVGQEFQEEHHRDKSSG